MRGASRAWYVKMDSEHRPAYWLINRSADKDPYIALEKDMVRLGRGHYFVNRDDAYAAIAAYYKFRDGIVGNNQSTMWVESQVMDFI